MTSRAERVTPANRDGDREREGESAVVHCEAGRSALDAAMEVIYACDQISGARAYQEDAYEVIVWNGADPDGCDILMVLADGMGGHEGGAKASELAVTAVRDTFPKRDGGIAVRLRASLDAANEWIGRWAANDVRYRGMGCTLLVCVISDDERLHWTSVGDSPLWLVRSGENGNDITMRRLNEDHSMKPVLEEMVRQGHITARQARAGSHQLRSALTGDEMRLVDEEAEPIRLEEGDRIILASDGLETLSEEEICLLGGADLRPPSIVASLLEAVEACRHPSQDNATAVVYRHSGPAAARRRIEHLTSPTRRL